MRVGDFWQYLLSAASRARVTPDTEIRVTIEGRPMLISDVRFDPVDGRINIRIMTRMDGRPTRARYYREQAHRDAEAHEREQREGR